MKDIAFRRDDNARVSEPGRLKIKPPDSLSPTNIHTYNTSFGDQNDKINAKISVGELVTIFSCPALHDERGGGESSDELRYH